MAGILDKVRGFYERNPYPNQRVSSKEDLLFGEHAKVMRRMLATVGMKPEELQGKTVLDAGCGTGEKAVYCALHGAFVDAFDISKASVAIGKKNAAKLGVKVNFSVSSFETVKLQRKYDLVLCIGTLHHTAEPKKNFMKMARGVKSGGRIALGLYNLYGRLACRVHRKLLWLGEKEPQRILEKIGVKEEKNQTWRAAVSDRYGAPHETYHSVEEALQWLGEAGMQPISTWPEIKLHSRADIKLKQLEWLFKNRGFFFTGAKK